MAYIEVRTTLPDHRKAKAAARELGMRRPWLIGHLVCLWAWALDNVPLDGFIGGIADADLEEAAQWPEDRAGELVPALVDAGFIDDDAGGRYLHDWEDYAGRLLKRREEDRARKAAERSARRAEKVSDGRPADKTRKPRKRANRPSTVSTAPTVDKPRPQDKPDLSAGQRSVSAGKAPKSAPSRAPARARTAPHPTVPKGTEKKEAPPARAGARAAGSAGASLLSIEPADARHPVARVLAQRFRWTTISAEQWGMLAEVVDNEYPGGTAKGGDPTRGWQWLADQLAALPKDAGSPLDAFLAGYNAELERRRAAADDDDRAWQETKARYADDPEGMAQAAGDAMRSSPRNGHHVDRAQAIALLRQVRGQVTDEAWTSMLTRHHVTEEELDAAP